MGWMAFKLNKILSLLIHKTVLLKDKQSLPSYFRHYIPNKRINNLLTLSLNLCALQFPALATWGQRVAMFLNAFSENKHLRMMRRKSLHLHSLTSLQWCAPVNNSA